MGIYVHLFSSSGWLFVGCVPVGRYCLCKVHFTDLCIGTFQNNKFSCYVQTSIRQIEPGIILIYVGSVW